MEIEELLGYLGQLNVYQVFKKLFANSDRNDEAQRLY